MGKPVMTAPNSGEGFVKQMPTEGLVNAKCYAVVDLGSEETEWKGNKKMTRKLQLSFETDQMGEFGDRGTLPLTLHNTYSFFLTEQANLFKDLTDWLGVVDPKMNVFDLVGRTAELMVSHEKTKAGKPFAKIVKIKAGKKDWDLINPIVMFSLNEFNEDEFLKLPERLRNKIQQTPEYAEAIGDTKEEPAKKDDDLAF